MIEELVRQELPIQSVRERGEYLTATVPINLKILQLPASIRTDPNLIIDAKDTVKEWYSWDMFYHLTCMDYDSPAERMVRRYELFDDNWVLGGKPDENGYLSLYWIENGSTHFIKFVESPVFLYNQFDENREFYTPESAIDNQWIECITRSIRQPETLFMDPEKMRKYGIECHLAKIDIEHGVAQVAGQAFCSDYQQNMGQALLLRDFAVFYLNKLLQASANIDYDPKVAEKQILETIKRLGLGFGKLGIEN